MGGDGLYYCPDCREACDIPLANSVDAESKSFACKLKPTRVLPRPQEERHVILPMRLAWKLLRLPAGKRHRSGLQGSIRAI